jgi:hypothetical protein
MPEISGIINANKRAFIIQVLGSLKSVFWTKVARAAIIGVIVSRQKVAILDGRREGITFPATAKHTAAMQRYEAGLEK